MLDFFSEALTLQGGIMREGSTAGVPWVEREGRLFSVGVWKGRKYTSADLDKMATSFQPPADERTWSVPLQVDHSDSASDTVGSIRKVWRQGTDLLGTLRFYGQKAVDAVKTGLWQKLSVGIRPDMSLHHVAVVAHPALPGATFSSDDWSGYSPAELRTAAAKLAAEVGLVIRNGEVHDPSKPLPTLADIEQEVAGAVKDGRIPGELKGQIPASWARARVANMLKAAKRLEAGNQNHSVEDEVAELMRARGREESPEDLVHSERREVLEQLMAEDRASRPAEIVERWVRAGLTHPSTASVEARLVATYSEEQLRSYSELKQLFRPFYWVSQAELDAEVHALQTERGHFTEGGREKILTHGEPPQLSRYSAEDQAEIDRLISLSDKHPSSKRTFHEQDGVR